MSDFQVFEVHDLALDRDGQIVSKLLSTRIAAFGEVNAAEIYMEQIYNSDGWEGVTVEINGRAYDCRAEERTHFVAHRRILV